MDEQGSVYVFVGFIVTIIVIGFGYTLIHGILNDLPTGPNTETMRFLTYALTYVILPVFLIAVLWFLNSMQKSRYEGYV